MLCTCTMCVSVGALKIKKKLEEELKRYNLEDEIQIIPIGSSWLCTRGPTLIVQPDGIVYQFLKEEDIPHLVEEHLLKGRPVKSLMYVLPKEKEPIPKLQDIPFYRKQRLIALWNRGIIDPDEIEEYIARDGYKALAKILQEMTPEEVIQEIKDSGLRGRGGAGFPTGRKWEFCRKNPGDLKYLICNADEGDPGAFMDRSIIEADPHSLIEGMLIAAYAIGAKKGYVYVRIEYPLAIKRLTRAISQAKEYGLLGKNIFGSNFNFDIEIFRGAGAFVCGEETSLIASIEAQPAEPRQRPPFPVEKGVFGCPTVINNVETLANLPRIINFGAEWFANIGTEKSKGTKVFSLAGNINNAGLVEVPMGITLSEMIYDIGGGIQYGKKFKAVQTGGPSGGVIPASLLDLPIDYERLQEAGAIMGSGGMVVVDEDTCMVDLAKYFLRFTKDESCGKCTSCREGTAALLEVLERISNGDGKEEDLDFLEELCMAIKDASLCGLGQTAPNPVLTSLQHFREEYIAHIKYKRCPAVVCKGIISSACQHICPLEQDVPCYIGLIVQEKFEDAINLIRKENPLPSVCGRVCHHPCESKCRAGEGGEDPIAIRTLKRFLADYELAQGIKPERKPKQERDEKVAIIGSGPAGLTCAHYLALEGYKVVIFESLPVPGGMLAVGIPAYRLPRRILNFEIENIKNLGVEIKTDTTIGREIQLSDLKKEYKVVFIATGAHRGLKMGVPGEETEGVIDAVEFLRKVNLGQEVNIGDRVIVVGGGNAAVDAARVAKRLGKDVKILYRRTRMEMPAMEEEIEATIEEGIEIQFLVAPVKVLSDNGRLTGIECIGMELGSIDKSGRRKPVPIEGSEFTLKIDTLIPAIGQEPDISLLTSGNGFKVSKWNTLEVDSETLCTNEEGIFAGGDVVTGPKTVTEAMSHGKIAAKMIHKYIQGEPVRREYKVTRPAMRVEPVELTDEEVAGLQKPSMPVLPRDERSGNFKEVELGFTKEMAIREAKRCFRCDLEEEMSNG
ncbi:NADH-quinone oxidoreductase subunit NuoF [candidate division WOR-3 bacterium]|nr:NADH-quinone oxidoreductase subunit NuoF [candidate division WOR-3 bacterium]